MAAFKHAREPRWPLAPGSLIAETAVLPNGWSEGFLLDDPTHTARLFPVTSSTEPELWPAFPPMISAMILCLTISLLVPEGWKASVLERVGADKATTSEREGKLAELEEARAETEEAREETREETREQSLKVVIMLAKESLACKVTSPALAQLEQIGQTAAAQGIRFPFAI